MAYKRLFIWVEGEDDATLFKRVLVPVLIAGYDFVDVRTHAKMKSEKIDNFIRSIRAMKADYFFVVDINSAPCVTEKKRQLLSRCHSLENDRIVVVIKEIEGWYLAGLSDTACKTLGVATLKETNAVTKERFETLMPHRVGSRIDFMLEILKLFEVEVAKMKNNSFRHFAEKHIRRTAS